jgi:hypothetical protein
VLQVTIDDNHFAFFAFWAKGKIGAGPLQHLNIKWDNYFRHGPGQLQLMVYRNNRYFIYVRIYNSDKLSNNTETKGADVLGDSSVKHGSDNLDIKKTPSDSASADVHK